MKGAFNSHLNIPITIGSVPYRPPFPAQYTPLGAAMPATAPPMAGFDEASAYPPAATQYGDSTQPYPNMGKRILHIHLNLVSTGRN